LGHQVAEQGSSSLLGLVLGLLLQQGQLQPGRAGKLRQGSMLLLRLGLTACRRWLLRRQLPLLREVQGARGLV
jgi:hypothetical protein